MSIKLAWDDDEEEARDAFEDELQQTVMGERKKKKVAQSMFGSDILRSLFLDDVDDDTSFCSKSCVMKSLIVFLLLSLVSAGAYLGSTSFKIGVTDTTSKYKGFPFNVSNSYFIDKSAKVNPNEIPLLLHEFDGSNNFGQNILSDCYGLKRISLKDFFRNKRYKDATYSNDYYVSATSLCDLMHLEPTRNKFRVISFILNPIMYYMIQKDSIANSLTRSIVCRPKDEKLTSNDVTIAKEFLEDICFVSMVSNHEQFMNILVERYNWQASANSKCEQKHMERYQKLKQTVRSDNLQKVVELNSMDLQLYFDFIRN